MSIGTISSSGDANGPRPILVTDAIHMYGWLETVVSYQLISQRHSYELILIVSLLTFSNLNNLQFKNNSESFSFDIRVK